MPVPTNTYDQQARSQAEDVQDEVYIISPVDNPICSMSKTIRATAKTHEWLEDSLRPNTTNGNAQVEGADAPSPDGEAMVARSNYCQIMSKVARVSGTLEDVDKYGRDSEMAYQLELRYGELANDEEWTVAGLGGASGLRSVATVGSNVAARRMNSLHRQLAGFGSTGTGVYEDANAITTRVALENAMLNAHQRCYTAGGNPSYLLVSPANSRKVADLAYATGRARDIRNDRMLVNVIDLYVSNFGELDVVLNRNQDNCWLGLDFNFLATAVLRPTRDWPLARLGDYDRRQVLRESTFAVLNASAHFMVDNIPAGTLT
jgi:hypothetical protein